jgi:hypothetical protein
MKYLILKKIHKLVDDFVVSCHSYLDHQICSLILRQVHSYLVSIRTNGRFTTFSSTQGTERYNTCIHVKYGVTFRILIVSSTKPRRILIVPFE